jgi:SAM-dependent methyltransferase
MTQAVESQGGVTMPSETQFDAWSAGQSYEHYMGRWSRKIAENFLVWLDPEPNLDWLEIGCGTGALSASLLSKTAPRQVTATDPSADFVAHAASQITDPRVRFEVADAQDLSFENDRFDIVTSALAMNFVPDRQKAFEQFRRVLRPGGTVAFYVWDYPGGGMGFIDAFWSSAAAVDPAARDLDESKRFPFCTPDGLRELCAASGLNSIDAAPIEVMTDFADFDAFWHPFSLGAGPAPGYFRTLPDAKREILKDHLKSRFGDEKPISLIARAWAIKGHWPLND